MEKKLFFATALSLLVLLVWSKFFTPQQRPEQQPQVAKPADIVVEKTEIPLEQPKTTDEFDFESSTAKIVFSEPQAAIQEAIFPTFQSYKFQLKNSLLVGNGELSFIRQAIDNKEVTYYYADEAKRITKRFIFSDSKYDFVMELKVQNPSSSLLKIELPIFLGTVSYGSNAGKIDFKDVSVITEDKIQYPNFKKDGSFNSLQIIGLRDRYFCAIIEPDNKGFIGFIKKTDSNQSYVGLISPLIVLAPGEERIEKFHIYIGPQDLGIIKAINPFWEPVIYFGKFDFIAKGLLKLLDIIHSLFKNWGWTIVMLSLLVYLILYPLTFKQMKSMKEMQVLQPKVDMLRATYKDNPQRLNKEIMELYKEHKVNPLGGCLPMILQIPIFFALYQVLTRSIKLKGADFLWIKDLSEPDKLFVLPNTIPVLGNEINILPILMAIGMFIQQKITAVQSTGPSAEQQKIMLVVFPIMFGVLFYHMPAGLVLYWFVNSALTTGYQIMSKRSK